MISAKVIADSISAGGVRLTTFVLKYPRFIHSEFMTHRMFSRNASSSRAIPFKKQVEMIRADLATPLKWLSNKPGMQGGEEIESVERAKLFWTAAAELAIEQAELLNDLGLHKQHVNRLLEPFSHINVVVTATDWNNFFELRCHPDAQPEIQELANKMKSEYLKSRPKYLKEDQWHLPFVRKEDVRLAAKYLKSKNIELKRVTLLNLLLKRSVAKCARVSYNNHDGTIDDFDKDCRLYDHLVGASPMHASPTEHQGTPSKNHLVYSGNFRGWIQYRKTLPNENLEIMERQLPLLGRLK